MEDAGNSGPVAVSLGVWPIVWSVRKKIFKKKQKVLALWVVGCYHTNKGRAL